MLIKCVVSCRDASGVPTFFPCTISCTQAEYDDGRHYDEARLAAEAERYEDTKSAMVYDERDGPFWLFDQLFPPDKPLGLVRDGRDPDSYKIADGEVSVWVSANGVSAYLVRVRDNYGHPGLKVELYKPGCEDRNSVAACCYVSATDLEPNPNDTYPWSHTGPFETYEGPPAQPDQTPTGD